MTIAVLSGKGGTGKTTVSTNLAISVEGAMLVDCDVEEPNCHIFFPLERSEETPVTQGYPDIDEQKCTHCGDCARFCHYNAILSAGSTTVTMPELCHDCGGCVLVCSEHAISYNHRPIGRIVSGLSGKTPVVYGILNVGELSGVRIIERMKETLPDMGAVIIDSSPGTACAAVAAVRDVDFAVLVTEPTPFGVSDMMMAVEMLESLNVPFGVVVNKSGLGDDEVYTVCRTRTIPVLGELPFSRSVAEVYSSGKLIVREMPQKRRWFEDLYKVICTRIRESNCASS